MNGLVRSLLAFAVSGAFLSLTGCTSAVEEGETGTLGDSRDELNHPDDWGLWPGPTVSVCWDAVTWYDTSLATFRTNVRTFVESNYGRVANLNFTGWDLCPTFNWDGTRWLQGTGLLALHTNTAVGTSQGGYNEHSTRYGYQPSGPTRIEWGLDGLGSNNTGTQGVILHEVGHGLGFGHEFNRPDNTSNDCSAFDPLQPGNTEGTPYDHDSIMNYTYCSGVPGTLSPWDIVGLQNAFGRKPAGLIVGLNDKCLTIPLNSSPPPSGTTLRTSTCSNDASQEWRRDTNLHLFAPAYTNRYMDVRGSLQSGAAVQVYTQNTPPTANQQWSFSNVNVRAMGDLCVDVPAGNFANNQLLQIYPCTGGSNQLFKVSPDGRFSHGNFCWDVPGGSTAPGTLIQIFNCNGGANQAFTLPTNGSLQFGGQCVDVVGGQPNSGSQLQLYPCKDDTDVTRQNQRYYLSGPIVAGNSFCLDMPGGNVTEGTPSQVYQCNAGANQRWDFYFGL